MTTQQLDRAAGQRLNEILIADDPTEGLWVAHDDGFFAEVVPEISALAMEQDPVHRHKDVLTHTFMVTANTSPRLVVRLAALFHDIGKPRTRRFSAGKVTFHHHEAVGARMTTQRLTLLGYEPAMTADVARLVELSGRFHGYQHGWEDSAVRRYARDAGPLLGDLNELVRCDCTTRRPEKVRGLQRRMDELEERIRSLAVEEAVKAERPELDGTEIMQILDIGPGRAVGEARTMLLEHARVHGAPEHDDAVKLLLDWWATRPDLRA
ncbi:MAG: nucleotidyltransferase [Ilumatobacteraceae bacterium]|nr:nucleotidyltransferase [Ilumatobacteraceae bacterium]